MGNGADSPVKCNKNEWDGRIVIAGTAKVWELSAMGLISGSGAITPNTLDTKNHSCKQTMASWPSASSPRSQIAH